jgi:hypothetical protein
MKELDKSGLEFVKMDAVKRINKLDSKINKNEEDIKQQAKRNAIHKN